MTLPQGAIFEAEIAPNVVLYDISRLLPAHKTKKHRTRTASRIKYIIIHKSGADGRAGLNGAIDCARYVVDSRDFPGMAYTFWLPRSPLLDEKGRFIAFRCQPDTVCSWHTNTRMNTEGVGIGVQGNYDGDGGAILRNPTPAQWTMLEALYSYLLARHNIDLSADTSALTGHFEHGKPVCPGDALVAWIREKRGEVVVAPPSLAPKTEEVDPRAFDVADRQLALQALGYPLGKVDGLWGFQSRAALEAFQRKEKLHVDGVWGPKTAAVIFARLKEKKLHTKSAFAALQNLDGVTRAK